jgi:2-polyprenyl-3-methyl-5-hydroxy-6-metoxy-1,4-benzoquinol methylase
LEKIHDKIYDAYQNELGESFGMQVRERIHWIVKNVQGQEVLEVGCSEGFTSILLGREGKNVLGIDYSSSAIKDALKNLDKEEEETKKHVQFEHCNFLVKKFEKKFDVVILGEVLEHIFDLDTFFEKVTNLTKEQGSIILTIPFGINDYIDHKRTIYIKDLLELQINSFGIENITFFGKWMGVIYRKNKEKLNIDMDVFNKIQAGFFINEVAELKRKLTKLTEQLENVKRQDKPTNDFKNKYIEEKKEKIKIQEQLYNAYCKQEELINNYKKLMDEKEKIQKLYDNLRNSKLGKLQVKYWNIRNQKRRN